MKALNLDKLDAFMEIEYDGEIYNAYTKNDIDDKAINAIPLDKIKKAREEIQKLVDMFGSDTVADVNMKSGLGLALEKIDKLIESEG